MMTTAAAVIVMWARQFASESRRAVADEGVQGRQVSDEEELLSQPATSGPGKSSEL